MDGILYLKSRLTPLIDALTMKEKQEGKPFTPAKYVLITGTTYISPNNITEIKASTDIKNLHGEVIKVIIISRAGGEGLDLKNIRQVHIMEPWYNLNRTEQVIGRAVRTCSHKNLDFKNRNVELYLYGTFLKNNEYECADMYIYRMAEIKAIKNWYYKSYY